MQILCEDEQGLFVSHNNPISEMMGVSAFAESLRCGRVVTHGYNTMRTKTVLFCENRDFQITAYMHRTTDMYGNKVGGLSPDDFGVIRAATVEGINRYMGDDEKPGF